MVFAFDTLSYARRLQEAGVSTQEAEAHADAARAYIMSDLVTKADLEMVHSQFAGMHNQFATVRGQFDQVQKQFGLVQGQFDRVQSQFDLVQRQFDRVHAEIASLRQEWREDLTATKRDLQGSMESMRRELTALIAGSELRVTVHLGAIMTLGIGVLAALIKL